MDIKDVSESPLVGSDRSRPPGRTPTEITPSPPSDLDAVQYDATRRVAPTRAPLEMRKLNEVIEATNVASEAVTKIGRILKGIEGRANQALSPAVSEENAKLMEDAARSLRNKIVKTASVETSLGAKPLSGDSIRLELEETLGKTLEIILPSGAATAFGLDAVNLSPKDLILDTVAKVQAARKGIEELRNKLALGIGMIKGVVANQDNAPVVASTTPGKLRDVEQVWTAVREARNEIKEQPTLALGVIGDLQRNASTLLL